MSLEHDAEAEESAPEEPVAETTGDTDTETESVEPTEEAEYSGLNRRGMLLSGGLLGLLGLGVGSASADASGQIGTATDPLNKIHANELNGGVTGGTALTSLTGDGLTLSSGSLSTNLGDGLELNGGAIQAKLGSGLSFSNGAIEAGSPAVSSLVTGSDFTALRVTENAKFTEPGSKDINIIGGQNLNHAGNGVLNAVVFGNDHTVGNPNDPVPDVSNTELADHVTVSGGERHTVSADRATVGGGFSNTASGKHATVGGGSTNEASGTNATISGGSNNASGFEGAVGGGSQNDAGGVNATIGGGKQNTSSGGSSTVAGGNKNVASGLNSFAVGNLCTADGDNSVAMGRNAKAGGNNGTFVFSDGTDTTVTATAENQVRFQAPGGFVVEQNVRTVTTDTTAKPGETIIADTKEGEITVTLPTAENGAKIILKCAGSNNLNVLTEGEELIDGTAVDSSGNPYVLIDGGARTLVSDGTDYFEVGSTTGR